MPKEKPDPPGFTQQDGNDVDRRANRYMKKQPPVDVDTPAVPPGSDENKKTDGLKPAEPLTSAAFGKPMGKGRKKTKRRSKKRRTTRKRA